MPLRSLQRQTLDRQRAMLDIKSANSSRPLTTVTSLPVYHVSFTTALFCC